MCASSFVFARTGFIGMCSGLARPRPSPRCRPTNRHVGCCDVTKDIAIFGDRSDLPSYIALAAPTERVVPTLMVAGVVQR